MRIIRLVLLLSLGSIHFAAAQRFETALEPALTFRAAAIDPQQGQFFIRPQGVPFQNAERTLTGMAASARFAVMHQKTGLGVAYRQAIKYDHLYFINASPANLLAGVSVVGQDVQGWTTDYCFEISKTFIRADKRWAYRVDLGHGLMNRGSSYSSGDVLVSPFDTVYFYGENNFNFRSDYFAVTAYNKRSRLGAQFRMHFVSASGHQFPGYASIKLPEVSLIYHLPLSQRIRDRYKALSRPDYSSNPE